MGFEPMESFHTLDRLEIGCLKPLSHRSCAAVYRIRHFVATDNK
jgi:hypothetical protein